MPSVTYLNTDGAIVRYGRKEEQATAVTFYDRSGTRIVHGSPASGGHGFDIGTRREADLSVTGMIWNEDSQDRDYRFESCGETHMLFVDGGNNQVIVGGCLGGDTTARLVAVDDAAGATGSPFQMYHFSASPADNDEQVTGYFADDSGANKVEWARFSVIQEDVTNCSKDAHMAWDVMVGNTLLNDVLKIGAESCAGQGSFLFNDDGDDFDFRVESDCNPNMIAICGALDNIGIGSAPVTGAFLSIIGSAQTRNVVTSVGNMMHFPADIHTDANCTGTIAEVADHFYGIKTHNAGAAMIYTQLSTLHLDGPPVANTCVTGTTIATLLIKAGSLQLGLVGGVAPTLDFQGSTACVTKFAAGTDPMNITYTLPADASIATGEQLSSTCAGVLSWTADTSLRSMKNLLGDTCKCEAYEHIVNAHVYDFTYKDEWKHKARGSGRPEPFTGIMADEAPWAMQGNDNQQFSAINAFGQLTAAFQVLAGKVDALSTP